jgi:hypothetical protein
MPQALAFNARVINGEQWGLKSLRQIFVMNRQLKSSTAEEAVGSLSSSIAAFRQAVELLGDGKFQNEIFDTPQKGRVHYWHYCVFTLEHHIHHLMELHSSLKALGCEVHTGTLYVGR